MTQPRSRLWADLTRDEIAAAASAGVLVVIPVGATEQHAGHLPAGTDTATAGAIALRAAQRCPHPVLVAPAVPVAFSPHHGAWAGTLTLRLGTLQALLDDLTAGIARAGFTRQLIVNGHGGNRAPLAAIAAELVCAGRRVGVVDYFAPGHAAAMALLRGRARGVTHAGEVETALMLALAGDDAATGDFIAARAAGLPPRLRGRQAETPGPMARAGAVWPSIYGPGDPGYSGDPAAATAETGDRLAEVYAEALAGFMAEFAIADLPAGVLSAPG